MWSLLEVVKLKILNGQLGTQGEIGHGVRSAVRANKKEDPSQVENGYRIVECALEFADKEGWDYILSLDPSDEVIGKVFENEQNVYSRLKITAAKYVVHSFDPVPQFKLRYDLLRKKLTSKKS